VQRTFWDELVAEHLIDFGSILQFSSVSVRMIMMERKGAMVISISRIEQQGLFLGLAPAYPIHRGAGYDDS